MIMLVTLLALSIGDLLGGTAIVETIFQWDGVGKLAVDSITMRDYPMIQAYVVWMAIIYVVVNLIADLLYHYLDPRVRLGGE
jgi:peptide/nickel transport system permease protein